MFKIFVAMLLTIGVAFAGQSGERPKIKKTNIGKVDEVAPVTRSEAAAIFARARKAIVAARIAQIPLKPTINPGNHTVPREEIILEMAKILDQSRNSVKLLPPPVKYNPKFFKVQSASAKSALNRLVSLGMIAPVGALATGPKPGISVAQFGDAVGFFLARMAEVTHKPSPRWSPYLMPPID
jgi:hypothetical protein